MACHSFEVLASRTIKLYNYRSMQFIVQVNTNNRLTSVIHCTCTAMYLKSKNLQGKKAITIIFSVPAGRCVIRMSTITWITS